MGRRQSFVLIAILNRNIMLVSCPISYTVESAYTNFLLWRNYCAKFGLHIKFFVTKLDKMTSLIVTYRLIWPINPSFVKFWPVILTHSTVFVTVFITTSHVRGVLVILVLILSNKVIIVTSLIKVISHMRD